LVYSIEVEETVEVRLEIWMGETYKEVVCADSYYERFVELLGSSLE
jgi:hypothetical protein